MIDLILVAVGGGAGTICRAAISQRWNGRPGQSPPWLPWGTLFVNLIGSLLLGVLIAVVQSQTDAPYQYNNHYLILGPGFLGGFTTFSTLILQGNDLWSDGHQRKATLYMFGTAILGIFAASIGFILFTYFLS
ncbi:hypothetical protein SY83_15405 [Paenibacillus swuensis]|uniref:Fluoride-specific ion channel FluC n=1 Tax=Paenibacillus swuensis TaxID=1178515 RepID=A0A172TPL2_9BACL|nr:hypothetical protein SY83_15405 [Paenibacillus swuensis]